MVDPKEVTSPRSRLTGPIEVLENTGPGGYSIASFSWDRKPAVGMRWNGGDAKEGRDVGNPQSRGLPTWFILPAPLEQLVTANLPLSDTKQAPAPKDAHRGTEDLDAHIEKVAEKVFQRLLDNKQAAK